MTINNFSHKYTLDKPYFIECYEQSVTVDNSWRAYAKAIFFCLFGGLLVAFTEINQYAAWFIFTLGILEALSVYYQKPWWVTRQMLSRASKSEVTLTVDEKGIASQSYYHQLMLTWPEIKLMATDKGWLLHHKQGKNYIAKHGMNDELITYLNSHLDNAS